MAKWFASHRSASVEDISDPEVGNEIPAVDLYSLHVAEYRFQVELNWKRTQYFIALNAAILSVGVGLMPSSGGESAWPAIGILLSGLAMALLSIAATMRQHEYYRNARDAAVELGRDLGLERHAVRTTRGMRPNRPTSYFARAGNRLGRVTTVTYVILSIFAMVELVGIGYLVSYGSAFAPPSPPSGAPSESP